eukprot:c11186_g1_i4.p1 GENE.c11186_g1_i4~~c11186_g1_i4.p1  ORF type:complete len:350 (+),score=50.29 c11186_g1_i4:415-1464(+)
MLGSSNVWTRICFQHRDSHKACFFHLQALHDISPLINVLQHVRCLDAIQAQLSPRLYALLTDLYSICPAVRVLRLPSVSSRGLVNILSQPHATNLEVLELSRAAPEAARVVANCPRLRMLGLQNCHNFSSHIPSHCLELEEVDVSGTPLNMSSVALLLSHCLRLHTIIARNCSDLDSHHGMPMPLPVPPVQPDLLCRSYALTTLDVLLSPLESGSLAGLLIHALKLSHLTFSGFTASGCFFPPTPPLLLPLTHLRMRDSLNLHHESFTQMVRLGGSSLVSLDVSLIRTFCDQDLEVVAEVCVRLADLTCTATMVTDEGISHGRRHSTLYCLTNSHVDGVLCVNWVFDEQ